MIIIALTREVRTGPTPRFRAVIRIDQIEYQLAGIYADPREAQHAADGMLLVLRKAATAHIRGISIYHERKRGSAPKATSAGLSSRVTP